ncbi:MAG: hypothetical protein FJW14_06840 [Acidimicrobiia bacterium]|nr:hypothetical protein [Acidimicrobiia bacterium]
MAGQLALDERWTMTARPPRREAAQPAQPLCAGCRAREARYGFRDENEDPTLERPRTLCFECFRVEIGRRQAVAARLARGIMAGASATQANLPLEQTLESLSRRRRRAQIAARHALGA